jgi:hypothetical protein
MTIQMVIFLQNNATSNKYTEHKTALACPTYEQHTLSFRELSK